MKRNNMIKKTASLIAITALFCSGMVFASNPLILSSFWAPITMSQKACIQKSSVAIKATGFTERFAVQQDSIFGVSSNLINTGTITCIAEKGVVFFTVAGSSGKRTYPLSQKLYKEFKK
jgi:hypothetical protein